MKITKAELFYPQSSTATSYEIGETSNRDWSETLIEIRELRDTSQVIVFVWKSRNGTITEIKHVGIPYRIVSTVEMDYRPHVRLEDIDMRKNPINFEK